jgi:hypothetical protein
LRHGDDADAPPAAALVEQLEQFGVRRVVGDAVDRQAACGERAGEDVDASDVRAEADHAAALGTQLLPQADERVAGSLTVRDHEAARLVRRS